MALGLAPFNAQADTIHVPPVVITELDHSVVDDEFGIPHERYIRDAVTFPSGPGEFIGPGFSESIGSGDTIVTRIEAPSGSHFEVYRHPDADFQGLFLNAYWQAGGDSTSNFPTPTITFENLVGTPPTITYQRGSLSNNGNVVAIEIQATVTADFAFSAIEISFPVEHSVSKTPRTYGAVNSSSTPSFGVSASGSADLEDRTVMALVAPTPPIAGSIEVHPALELVITDLDPAKEYILQSSEDLEVWHDEEIISGTAEEISRFRATRNESKRFWRLVEVLD